jgi:hypothetical protein
MPLLKITIVLHFIMSFIAFGIVITNNFKEDLEKAKTRSQKIEAIVWDVLLAILTLMVMVIPVLGEYFFFHEICEYLDRREKRLGAGRDKYEKLYNRSSTVLRYIDGMNVYYELRSIRDDYFKLTKDKVFKEIAYNRFNYIIEVIQEAENADINIKWNDSVKKSLCIMAKSCKDLFKDMLNEIAENEKKQSAGAENAIQERAIKYAADTEQFKQDFVAKKEEVQ